MALTITPLTPAFGAEIAGIDAAKALRDAAFRPIRDAFEEYSVILLRDQGFDDASQIAFSKHFGPLEISISANPAGGTHFARQSNVDMTSGGIIAKDDRRMRYQLGNYLWHTDSSFKPVPALCSLLSAREVPPEGGNTEFASMRAAHAALPAETRRKLEGLVAVHSLAYSRARVDPTVLTPNQRQEVPAVRQTMVRSNPVNGRNAIFIGAHASHVEGWPLAEGRQFIAELMAFATQPRFTYSHRWRPGDIVIWDNRAVLHRATAYDTVKYRRLMQRTTVAGDGPTVADPLVPADQVAEMYASVGVPA
ncbi:MAG: TauD/TfdA family dioxygenase [Alphaproteobacteria bacterium]|nr:TauD/TfdA family dioxygenase [Alphaproteobacteria bacterium]